MTVSDYTPLVEKVRTKISSWTARYLSYAGRLQLITSVIASLLNFWISAYRLPNGCIQEIERLCSAFLWSGPDLNAKKAKIAWNDVCRPKAEGGLGIKSLMEANKVSCLKLIWRIVSKQPSLWVAWITKYLIRKESFWSIKLSTTMGSWMWKKLLKYRETARSLHRMKVQSGTETSFWYDNWSSMGRLIDVTGPRGVIDLGIKLHDTVEFAISSRRRRRHRTQILNDIEIEIDSLSRRARRDENDISLWRSSPNKFKTSFSTKDTWNLVRLVHTTIDWYKGVWFPYATPKYSFLTWLAIHDRLSTGNRIKMWNSGQRVDCVLCGTIEETRNHLFFSCQYSTDIWHTLANRLLWNNFTTDWDSLIALLHRPNQDRLQLFLFRYAFQSALYHIWRERNARRHGEIPLTHTQLTKMIDKNVRNRISAIRDMGDHRYEEALRLWFSAQQRI